MSPDKFVDPGMIAVLIGAVGKGKDFVITKGLTVLITAILSIAFSAGVVYSQFNAILAEMKAYQASQEAMSRDMNIMKADIKVLKTQLGDVKVDVGKINDWMRMYGPKRLIP